MGFKFIYKILIITKIFIVYLDIIFRTIIKLLNKIFYYFSFNIFNIVRSFI